MLLTPGTRLGPFEILVSIGAGGMGEVYKARDTRLDRIVAIKVSNEQFSERFEREARAVAALNHSNICTLYDVGPNYLVMEYIEGTPLQGPMPLDQALKYAVQICDALDAAHKKGIIHRDLKPANILVTKSGIKLLDFGLAKMGPALKPPSDGTLTMALTGKNEIVGTLYYMSPEQLQANADGEIDARSDIFSFGCVLYEMLTGKRAFEGASAASVIAAILERPAPSVAQVAPAGLDWALRLCLKKDPDDRWQSVRDVRAVLERVPESGTESPARPTGAASPFGWIAAAVFALAAVAAWILYFRAASVVAPEARLDIVTPPTSAIASFALSPDGRRIAYVATVDGISRLWVRALDSTSAQQLPGTEGALNPFWSPDGRSLGFLAGLELKRIDLAGGQPQNLAAVPPIGPQGTWGANGVVLFGSGSRALFRVSASGGQAVEATKLSSGQIAHRVPRFLPGGRQFLYMADGAESAVWLGSIDGGQSRRLTTITPGVDSPGEYLPPGWLVRVRQNALVAQRFDAGSGQLSGDPITLATSVGVDPRTQAGAFSVSPSGIIAWRSGEGAQRQLLWFNRKGQNEGAFGATDPVLLNPELSPDGKRVAVTRGRMDDADVWIQEGTRTSRFTFDPADDRIMIWSPDGLHAVFASSRKGYFDLYQKSTDGTGGDTVLLESADFKFPNSWSPDGRSILYWSKKNNGDLMVLPLTGDRKPFPFLSTPFNEEQGVFSPDGRWVAYDSDESGRFEVYVRPFPGPGGQWQVSTGGGNSPRWRADGKELYYVAPDAKLMAVTVTARGGTFVSDAPETLFQTHITVVPNKAQYDVARDGRFLIVTELDDTSTEPIHLLLNWMPPPK